MSSFRNLLAEHNITPEALVRISHQLEAARHEGRVLRQRRWKKRKYEGQKSYADAGLAKPRSGRGVSAQQVEAALSDKPLPRRVRGKLVRAVNALFTKQGAPVLEAKAVFGEAPVRRGAKPEAG